jgi:hypothetical protein
VAAQPNLVALGAKDSGSGGFDDYGGVLEIHRLNFREAGLKCSVAGTVRRTTRITHTKGR